MTWFHIDDRMPDHPKTIAAGNAAIGLWTRCGGYASKHSTDGFIPREIAANFGSVSQAKRLVDVGLWITVPGGYQMKDFLDYNPSSDQVKAKRKATAKRVAEHRARLAEAASNGVTNAVSNSSQSSPVLLNTSVQGLQVSTDCAPNDDDFAQTVNLVAVRKCTGRQANNPLAYMATVMADVRETLGLAIRGALETGLTPEQAADAVMGAVEAPKAKPPPDPMAAQAQGALASHVYTGATVAEAFAEALSSYPGQREALVVEARRHDPDFEPTAIVLEFPARKGA